MWSAAKETVSQFLKDMEKSPGWFSLIVLLYVLFDRGHAAVKVSAIIERLVGKSLIVPDELLVILVAGLAYQLGDALDAGFYADSRETKRLRRCARFKLGVHSGVYGVASSLINASEKTRGISAIWVWNEISKLLRSLGAALLMVGIGLVLLADIRGLLFLLLATPCLALFRPIKNWHKQALYRKIQDLLEPKDDRKKSESLYDFRDIDEVRFFFWDGNFVSAIRLRKNDKRLRLLAECEAARKKEGDTQRVAPSQFLEL